MAYRRKTIRRNNRNSPPEQLIFRTGIHQI
jgi:hypothetical protein